MTPSDLKYEVENRGKESHFFAPRTMKAFGDRMSNYGVRSATIRATTDVIGPDNKYVVSDVEVWELYRRRPVKHGVQTSAYFRKDTFARCFPWVD